MAAQETLVNGNRTAVTPDVFKPRSGMLASPPIQRMWSLNHACMSYMVVHNSWVGWLVVLGLTAL